MPRFSKLDILMCNLSSVTVATLHLQRQNNVQLHKQEVFHKLAARKEKKKPVNVVKASPFVLVC